MHRTLSAALLLAGCAPAAPPPERPPPAEEEVVVLKSGPGEDLGPATGAGTSMAPRVQSAGEPPPEIGDGIPIIEPGEIVPPFEVTTVGGEHLDSKDIVGKRPFVVVFFATWCPVCAKKLPVVDAALDAKAKDDLLVLGGAYDEDDTWDEVEGYVKRHGLDDDLEVVRIMRNRRFGISYDPFGSFPLVMVVNRAGIIVELQMGMKPSHGVALENALEIVQSDLPAP